MKFKETAGVDVSKLTIDVCIHLKGKHKQFKNNTKGFRAFVKWTEKNTGVDIEQVMICFEHTGLYSLPLAMYLSEKQIRFSMVAALQIKRSLGIVRGKNDKIDAGRIAEYAHLRRKDLKEYHLPSGNILKLQKLLSLRNRMVRQRAGYKSAIKEYKALLKRKDNEMLFNIHEQMTTQLTRQITKLEKEIKNTINKDEQTKKLFNLITSVKGVGLILAANFLVITNCFSGFDNSRKFACYAGIAPFEKQSGTSLNSPARVSHYANKKIKSLLNMAASSAIQCDPELKAYYQKRVESGKSKMSTLNIVRNKIVHRVFAVVKRKTPYVPLFQHTG